MILQSGLISVYTIAKIRHHKSYVKSLVKKNLKSGKSDSRLTLFTEAALKNAEWEHSKEFFLGNEKYDVVRTEDSAGIRIYHCVNDKVEQELFGKLDRGQKQNTMLEDVLKKFCIRIPDIHDFSIAISRITKIHAIFSPDQYTYGFSYAHFRPPTCLA